MGRQESLTAWALGRGAFEDEVIQAEDPDESGDGQQYNAQGHPRNPETKRREREMVRAANEVMQVTGIVEDARAARAKVKAAQLEKLEETYVGLRYMEYGRPLLVAGVWGVLGLRRRILLYRPYAQMGLLDIVRQELNAESISSLLLTGIPSVAAYHFSDYAAFIIKLSVETSFDMIRKDSAQQNEFFSTSNLWMKAAASGILDAGFNYLSTYLRVVSIVQQLNLVPGSRFFPKCRTFLPFAPLPPISLSLSKFTYTSFIHWGYQLLQGALPLLVVLGFGQVKYRVSQLVYRPIYKSLPRPTGSSMFEGLEHTDTSIFDGSGTVSNNDLTRSRRGVESHTPVRIEDEQTLRALEGYPATGQDNRELPDGEQTRTSISAAEVLDDGEASDDEDDGLTAHLISFDVEATENPQDAPGPLSTEVENSETRDTPAGSWSAELRSAHEPKSMETKYHVTGITMLPTILATEGFRELISGVLTIPVEAIMVRAIGRLYRKSLGLDVSDMYELFDFRSMLPAAENIFGAIALQMVFTGVVWASYTYVICPSTVQQKGGKDDSPVGAFGILSPPESLDY